MMVAGMFLIRMGRHWRSEWHFRQGKNEWPLDTGGISDFRLWDTHFSHCLSISLQSIVTWQRTKVSNETLLHEHECHSATCLVHRLLKSWCYFVLGQTKFVIWSVGSHSDLVIIWIFLSCMQKGEQWEHRNAAQIPRFAKSSGFWNYPKWGGMEHKSHRWQTMRVISEKVWV